MLKIIKYLYCIVQILLMSSSLFAVLDSAYAKNVTHKNHAQQYRIYGKRYKVLSSGKHYQAQGLASWYGSRFHRKRTSSGERYNMYQFTAAHKTLPLQSYVKVTNLINGRSVVVKINDRGPFIRDRLIDLSYAAAKKLGMVGLGIAPVVIKSTVFA